MDSSPCCPPGSWPQALLQSKDDLNKDEPSYSPAGSVVTIAEDLNVPMPMYVVEPSSNSTPPTGVLIVLQDIFSVRVLHPDARSGDRLAILCDHFASSLGYAVAMPSLFRNNPVDFALQKNATPAGDPHQQQKMAWLKSQSYSKTGPDLKAADSFVRNKWPGVPVGVIGFCYGAWLLSKASPELKFACAVGCHPSTQNENLQGGDEIAMLSSLCQPTLFLCAGNDSAIFKENGEGKKALEKSGGGVEDFPEMLHGWVCRGDMQDAAVKRDVEKALASVQSFFKANMK